MIIKRTIYYFIIVYCLSFFFLIFDFIIGIFQLIDIIHGGVDLLNTSMGQFRLMNLLIDSITLIVMSLFLVFLWKRIVIKTGKEDLFSYYRFFKIMVVVGGMNLILAVLLINNPFLHLNLRTSPLGHIYDVMVKVGLIFLLLGIVSIISIKVENQEINSFNEYV